jgi:4-diphosphocytidyl-2-C-methyl-D-erythritol kinase
MQEIERYIAYSKINLGLEVLRKREDGYHELNTIFYRVLEPHDSISVEQSDVFQLTCSESSLPTDSRNLMMRATNVFTKEFGTPLPSIHVHLDKQIPMGAGLGGGSSDAAIMLEILHDKSDTPPSMHDLMKLAATIGADVPFFLSGEKASVARGIGEQLSSISLELDCSILIVKDPSLHVSTREAYQALSIKLESKPTDYFALFEGPLPIEEFDKYLRNDFEPSVFERYPRLAEIKEELYTSGALFAMMSGSGSAILGLFEDYLPAQHAKDQFERKGMSAFLS